MKNNYSFAELEKKFKEDWPDNPASLSFCLQIVEYLTSKRYEDVQHLTKQSFIKLLSPVPSDKALIDILRYLNGSRAEVLTTNFELIDDSDEPFVLSIDDVRELQETGTLAHPNTGELVEDPEAKVYMFFSPSSKMRQLQPAE